MSSRTVIRTVARPAPVSMTCMPSACDAWSPRYSAAMAPAAVSAALRSFVTRSSTREPGRALLHERGNALGIVRRPAQLTLQLALDLELLFERAAPTFVDRL